MKRHVNRKVLGFAAVSALLLTTLILLVRLDHRRQHLEQLYTAASSGDQRAFAALSQRHLPLSESLVQQLAVSSSTSPEIRAAAFNYIAQDRHRQIRLCRYIGEENGELDEQAEDRFFDDLESTSAIAPECLHAVLQRLIDLPSTARQDGQFGLVQTSAQTSSQTSSQTSPGHVEQLRERAVSLLRLHREGVAAILRQRFGLGSASPQPAVLQAVVALQLSESCVDLERSEQLIESSGGLYAEDYRDTAATLCR